jgi:hypothetical protein
MGRQKQIVASDASADRRTGYYVAGMDWPAISNDISISTFYEALEKIDDAAIKTAAKSLQVPSGSEGC